MATNDRTEHGFELTPINDNHGDGTMKTVTPEDIRGALRPLAQLLARRAAQEWLVKVANDNTPHKSKPTLSTPSPEDTCPDNHK
jgi:hypothetical protein